MAVPVWQIKHPNGDVEDVQAPTEQAALDFVNAKLRTAKREPPKTRTGQFIQGLKTAAEGALRDASPALGLGLDAQKWLMRETPTDAADYERTVRAKRERAQPYRPAGDIPWGKDTYRAPVLSPLLDKVQAFNEATVAPAMDEYRGQLAALGNEAGNLFRPAGKKRSSRAAYLATRDLANEDAERRRQEFPASSLAGEVAGAFLPTPEKGGKAVRLGRGFATRAAEAIAPKLPPGLVDRLGTKTAKTLVPKVLGLLDAAPVAAATGSAWGAGMGALEGTTPEERAGNAWEGAKTGLGYGLGLHFGLPVAGRALGAAGDALGVIGQKTHLSPLLRDLGAFASNKAEHFFGPERPPGPVIPEKFFGPPSDQASNAQRAAIALAEKKGMTPDKLRARDEQLKGLKPTTAEILGTEGEGLAKAVTRRAGTSGDLFREQIFERNSEQPGSAVEDFARILGVDPATAAGNLDAMSAKLKAEGGADIEAAIRGEFGVNNPQVDFFLNTPTGKQLVAEMNSRFRDEGDLAMGLTMGRVETPDPRAGGGPFEAPTPGREMIAPDAEPPKLPPAEEVKVPRGPAEPPSRGPSLLTFVRASGKGLTPQRAGEATQAQMRLGARPDGADIESMIDDAMDAGYYVARPDAETFWQHLEDDAAGRGKIYAREPDWRAQQAYEARKAAEEQNAAASNTRWREQQEAEDAFREQQAKDQAELDDWRRRMDEIGDAEGWASLEQPGHEAPAGEETGANAPNFEPVYEEKPTPEALNRIRQYGNERVEYDFAGRPAKDSKNLARYSWAKRFTDLLAGDKETGAGAVIPGLRGGLNKYHAGASLKDVFNEAKGKLLGLSVGDFGSMVAAARKTPGADGPVKAAVANDFLEMAMAERLGDRRLITKAVESKIRLLFGEKEGTAFMARMRERAKLMASGKRISPHSGSDTAGNLSAMEQIEQMSPEVWTRVASKLRAGDPAAAIWDMLGTGAGKLLAEARTAGSSEAFRNELGQLLAMSPTEFAAVMERFPELDVSGQKAVAAIVRGLGAGNIAGAGVATRQADEREQELELQQH